MRNEMTIAATRMIEDVPQETTEAARFGVLARGGFARRSPAPVVSGDCVAETGSARSRSSHLKV